MNMKHRKEKDTMGTVLVPEKAYYGAQTQRAVDNFLFSGLSFPSPFIKALGASPISLPVPEVYTALERGVVDGLMFIDYGITSFGWHEIAKYKLHPSVFQQETATLMNMDVWKKLSKDLQDVLMSAFIDFEYISTAVLLQIKKQEWEVCEKAGMTISSLPTEDAKKFQKIAYDATWKVVMKTSPDYGSKLKKLFTKK